MQYAATASSSALFRAERRVREIQAKLHRWAEHGAQRDSRSARCLGNGLRRVREAARGNPPAETPAGRPGPDLTARRHMKAYSNLSRYLIS